MDCYTLHYDRDADKYYGLSHGRTVTGPMDMIDADKWLEMVRGNEG